MKAGWKTPKFGDACEIKKGKKPTLLNAGTEGAKPYLVAKYLRGAEPADFASVSDKNSVSVSASEIIIICDGSNSGEIFIGFDGILSSTMAKIAHGNEIDNRFLMHFLDSLFDKFNAAKTGAAIPHLDLAALRDEVLPLPPLPEQKRIVAILDEAFDGIASAESQAEKNFQNARAIFESNLESVFTQRGTGWMEKSIGELCERLHQGLNTAGEKVKFYEVGYPIIQTRNIDVGVVELDSKMKFMSEEDWHRYKDKYRPEIGDVFFTNIGTIGKTAIVTTDRDYLIHWNIFKLRPLLGKITSEFLRYTLEQLTLSGYFQKLQKGGTVDFVTKKMISEALIFIPAIAEQKTIVASLDALREETQRLANLYERKLTALEALKQSLLHQAFTGQI
jgi:type I restriction enzyme S subunit